MNNRTNTNQHAHSANDKVPQSLELPPDIDVESASNPVYERLVAKAARPAPNHRRPATSRYKDS